MDILECILCNNKYDEGNRRARTLTCAHYFCQECLDQVIDSDNPYCPTCREVIHVGSADLLPPNFLMDDLLSKMKLGSVSVKSEGNEGDDEDFTAGSCQKHKKCQLYFTCKTHNVKICRDCTVIEHPPTRCQIISFEDQLEETKTITLNNLKTQTSNREKDIEYLQDIINKTKSKNQKHTEEIFELQSKIERLQCIVCENEQVVKYTGEAIEDCEKNKSSIYKIKEKLISSRTVQQVNSSVHDADHIINLSKSIEFSVSMTKNFNVVPFKSFQDIKTQAEEDFLGNCLTAEINGEIRIAVIVAKDGNIHLSALSPCGRPPASETTVTVSTLLAQHPSTRTNIYMTLASDADELGTIYVKLRDDPYSQYIRKLCMGTIGPCYRGTIFDGRGGYSLYTGDVTKYDSSHCTELPVGLPEKVRLQKGTVYLENETGLRFCISDAVSSFVNAVGDVVKGLNVLEVAWNYPKGEIIIKDVGIVLE
ncbi:unnamed protein product [Meganyctiphanes norvegica]|uniref:RING-type domain-containing protein n=1 Tax=Meganyctiphanes norvegica TaxID=48144 RepID=A0AAV2PSK6_MEGNR